MQCNDVRLHMHHLIARELVSEIAREVLVLRFWLYSLQRSSNSSTPLSPALRLIVAITRVVHDLDVCVGGGGRHAVELQRKQLGRLDQRLAGCLSHG